MERSAGNGRPRRGYHGRSHDRSLVDDLAFLGGEFMWWHDAIMVFLGWLLSEVSSASSKSKPDDEK